MAAGRISVRGSEGIRLGKEKQKKLMNIIGIRFKERQICVSKKECITSTKMVYDEEDEVI